VVARIDFMMESHSSDLIDEEHSMSRGPNSGGGSWMDGALFEKDAEFVMGDGCAGAWSNSGGGNSSKERTAESNDGDRTDVEKRRPSSATSSVENPAHSILRLGSIGVPLPVYLIKGQEPRVRAGAVVDGSFPEEDFSTDLSMATVGAFCDMNENERDKIGEEGGDGVVARRSEVDGVGDVGGERHKSSLNSDRTSNIDVSTPPLGPTGKPRIVSSSSSSSLSGAFANSSSATSIALVRIS
jgi:hypothetical protein